MIATLLSDFLPWLAVIGAVIAAAFGWGMVKKREGANAERERQNRVDLDAIKRRDKTAGEINVESDEALAARLADGR